VDDPRLRPRADLLDAFERVDFTRTAPGPGGSGPPTATSRQVTPLTGSVTTRDGRRLPDGWSTTSTRARPPRHSTPPYGVNYTIPFGLIVSLWPHGVRAWRPERQGDSPQRRGAAARAHRRPRRVNGGMLIFVEGRRPSMCPDRHRAVDFDARQRCTRRSAALGAVRPIHSEQGTCTGALFQALASAVTVPFSFH